MPEVRSCCWVVGIWASVCFKKCFDEPLSAFMTNNDGKVVGWVTGEVFIYIHVLFNLLVTKLLLWSGPKYQVIFLSLPPIRFYNVTAFLRPSAGVQHSELVWLHRPCIQQYLVKLGLRRLDFLDLDVLAFIISICFRQMDQSEMTVFASTKCRMHSLSIRLDFISKCN